MLILTLIKDTALPPLTSAWLRVCVCTRLSAWLTGVQATQWSVSIPKLCCSLLLYHCNPGSCNLRGILPSIMCSRRGLGTGCQSVCVFVCMCSCEPMKWQVWAMCVCVCEIACEHAVCLFLLSNGQVHSGFSGKNGRAMSVSQVLLFEEGNTWGAGGWPPQVRPVSITGKKAMAIQVNLSSRSPLLHLTCCFVPPFLSAYIPFFRCLNHTCLLLQLLFCVCMRPI